jgi:uncharacterized protein YndB with AHSA1/START domain
MKAIALGPISQPGGCESDVSDVNGSLGERVRREMVLPAPPVDVWEAVSTPSLGGAWLGDVIELVPRPGGRVTVRAADGSTLRGRVEVLEPGRRLVLRWRRLDPLGSGSPRVGAPSAGAATRVVFELEPTDAGTLLTVTEERVDLVASVGTKEAS